MEEGKKENFRNMQRERKTKPQWPRKVENMPKPSQQVSAQTLFVSTNLSNKYW
jgi:hypothetical protein